MNRPRILIATLATTTLFILPTVSHASQYQTALNACVKAFMSTNFADKAPLKVLDVTQQYTTLLPAFPRSYSFTLAAVGATSGKRYAQSTCTADRTGSVTIEGME